MKARKLYPWLPLIAASLAVAVLAAARWLGSRPAPQPPGARPDVPPAIKLGYFETGLHALDPDLRVVRPDGLSYRLVVDPDAGPAALGTVPDTEEYADCWRGVVLCEADWAATHPDEAARPAGPHSGMAGDFRLFGDVELLRKVRPAAAMVNFGPYRGTP